MLTRKKRIGIGKQQKFRNSTENKPHFRQMLIVLLLFLLSLSVSLLDSSPKSSTAKNIHLLSRETIQDTANMLSTPPTRRHRFINNQTAMNDDSPVLSQEAINISWKWNNDSTPVRPTNKVSKLRQRTSTNSNSPIPQQLQQLKRSTKKRNSGDSPNGMTVEGTSTVGAAAAAVFSTGSALAAATSIAATNAEPENNSPKGLYKFQEEMRKIQFDLESDTSRDNINNDRSVTVADTGYPINADQMNANYSDNLDIEMMEDTHVGAMHQVPPPPLPQQQTSTPTLARSQKKSSITTDDVDALANDLFNDSDFDQILLTCQIPAQKSTKTASETVTVANQMTSTVQQLAIGGGSGIGGGGGPSQLSVKKASSAPEIKTQNSNSDSSGSNWNLIDDDCFDDFVKDFDVDIPNDATAAFNTSSSKFTRHKSMPQPQPQTSSSSSSSSVAAAAASSTISKSKMVSTTTAAIQQQSNVYNVQNNFNRKSFIRHESMPISNNSTINRFSNNSTANSMRPNSSTCFMQFCMHISSHYNSNITFTHFSMF